MAGPNEDSALTAAKGTIADADGITTFTPAWAWHEGDTADGDFTAIASATAATFTPLQAHVGKFIRACATFDDDDSNSETRCWTSVAAVVNVNDAPVGLPNTIYVPAGGSYTFSVDDFPVTDEDGDSLVIAGVTRASKGSLTFNGNPITSALTDFTAARLTAGAFGYTPPSDAGPMSGYATFEWIPTTKDNSVGNVGLAVATMTIDLVSATASAATGAPTVTAATGTAYNEDVELTAAIGTVADTNGIPTHTRTWQWQSAAAPATGTPAASAYTDIAGATADKFTPLQAHVGQYIRACLSFTDGAGTAETRCSTGTIIANVSDRPVAQDHSINVSIEATMANPHIFSIADFPFMDEDGDALARVTLASVPAAGTLRNGSAAAMRLDTIEVADLANLVYWPESGQSARDGYATFTFRVDDDGNDGGTAGRNAGTEIATITINLVPPGDPPTARSATHTAMLAGTAAIPIPASLFINAYSDPDGDALASVTITSLPPVAEGILRFNNIGVGRNQIITMANGDFDGGSLTFTPAANAADLQGTMFNFTLSDGFRDSNTATLTIRFGQDIEATRVTEVAAVFNAATVATAANAIMGAMSASPAANAFDLSLDGTSMMGTARTLGQNTATDTDGHTAWYHGTTAEWEYNAAYNASDNSAESLRHRLNAMANGDIAMNWQAGGSAMRFWARYQSTDLSGNEGETLEYDGSGTGFYIGADRRINDKMRLGLAISSDSADLSIDLDGDMMDDEATRSATTIYPYLHIDMGNNNQARIIAGIGSGDLDIKSTANNNDTASADLSWNMLAASISHHRPMKGNLSARFDGSLQLGNTSTDETTFTGGSTLMAADSSTNELSINAQLRYQTNNFTPHASITARKQGGDLSQSLAMDLGLGADLQTRAAIIRLGLTRQINATTHQRHSISLDASTNPGASGISASLGSRYDSITGRPQWQSTIGWQRNRFQTSLQASPGDYRLRARLRW